MFLFFLNQGPIGEIIAAAPMVEKMVGQKKKKQVLLVGFDANLVALLGK